MEKKNDIRKALPYITAIGIFIVFNLLYFAPQFKGDELRQSDVIQYKGMTQDILEHREAYHEDPQWEGRMFSGMPAYMINVQYKGTVIKAVAQVFYFLGQPAALIFIAMSCFFFMLLCLRINPWISIVPALAYGFSTYFFIILDVGHITKMVALAFAPMMLGGVFYAYRRNMWVGAALTGVFATLEIGANHTQITYYFLLILLAFWINELIRSWKEKILPRFGKVTALLALAALLAVGSNATMLYYVSSHASETMRGGSELSAPSETESQKGLDLQYATAWSYGPGETLNLLIPNFMGGSSHGGFSADGPVAEALAKYNQPEAAPYLPGYWGPQPGTSGPVYIGAVVIFLAVLGLFLLGGTTTWWLVVITLLSVFLAWGEHMLWFTKLFFNYFPLYSKFRTVSMILVIAEWTLPFLAALTLQKLWSGNVAPEKLNRGLKYSLGIVGGIALLMALFGGTLMSFTGAADANFPQDLVAAMQTERAALLRADAWRTLIFVLLTGGAVWLFTREKIKRALFVVLMAGLVTADMVPVNLRFLNHDKFVPKAQNTIRPTEADKQILADKEPGFRVLNLTVSPFNDATTSYFHRSVGGYHGAKLKRYQDLIEHQLSKMNWAAYDMLNTKYIIVQDKETGAPQVQINPNANGPAWFVDKVIVTSTPDEEMAGLDSLNTRTTAVTDKQFAPFFEGVELSADSTASIRMTEYRVNLQKYEYTAAKEGMAVFSEIYYPKGWTAYIDGQEAPYFRADYLLRAMILPAGQHEVEFRFRAPHYSQLTAVTTASSLLLLLGLIAAVAGSCIKKKKEAQNTLTEDVNG